MTLGASMAPASRFAYGNLLLNSLKSSHFSLLEPNLIPVELPLRMDLERPKKPIEKVYFFEQGIASVVAVHPHGETVEVGVNGFEGMSGLPVVLGNDRSPHSSYMQAAGHGLCISADNLRLAMEKSVGLRLQLLRFVQAFVIQTSHTAVANGKSNIEQRLARWLLMSHDRFAGDELKLTHEFLGLMLAVRRAGVTVALQSLAKQGFIKSDRRLITVVDRKGLEKKAGPFYGTPEAEYRRLLAEQK
jgi:CRP-like cAMP-binding protein